MKSFQIKIVLPSGETHYSANNYSEKEADDVAAYIRRNDNIRFECCPLNRNNRKYVLSVSKYIVERSIIFIIPA